MAEYKSKPLHLDYSSYKRNNKSIVNLQIDNYQVKKILGAGNFSSVFLAQDQEKRKYALKVIDLREIQEEKHPKIKEIKERLAVSEPKLMMKCNSEHLLKCYDIYENKDLKILVMEYCSGQTLQSYLKKKKKIPEKEAVEILRHIISGIAELHARKVIHRDLKTENIMEHQGIYKIIDFGFSKEINSEMRHTTLGTPTTMAPEVKNKKNYGLKADIWSLGIIFIEIVFGVQPYDSANANKFYNDIEKRFSEPEPTPFLGITLSKEAHDFLRRVLKINSAERMDWKELIEHPFIKVKESEPLPERFMYRASLIMPEVDPRLANEDLISETVNCLSNRSIEEQQNKTKLGQSEEKPEQIYKEKLEEPPEEKPEQISKEKSEEPSEEKLEELPEEKSEQISKEKSEEPPEEKEINNVQKKDQPQKEKTLERFERNRRINQRELLQEDQEEIKKRVLKSLANEMKRSSQIFRERKERQLEQSKNSEENYQRCLGMHLSCLKTELIFNDVFTPLETQQLLNFQQRQTIQFSYLLLSRCFLNMSPLKIEIKENPYPHKSFVTLNQQIQTLYNKVKQKFEEYSAKLTAIQNNKIEIAKDYFSKMIWKQYNEQKNLFLGSGIEKNEGNSFGDFTTKEQIAYTCTYINKVMPLIVDLGAFTRTIKQYLENYEAIQTVELSQLTEETFKEFTQRIIG